MRTLLWIPALAMGVSLAPSALAQESERRNDSYLDPELDIDTYIDRFESETREVFANRGAIVEALELAPGMWVADIGAGTGAFLPSIAEAIGPSGNYFGVDISPRFVEHIRARARESGYDNVTAVLSSSSSTTLPENSIDVLFVCDAYHHFDDHVSMLASMHRALKPGGTMAIVDFDRVPGVSRPWIMDHVRGPKTQFIAEIEGGGFQLIEEVDVPGLVDNFFLRFRAKAPD